MTEITGTFYQNVDSIFVNSRGMIEVVYNRQTTWNNSFKGVYYKMVYAYSGDQLQKIDGYTYDVNTGQEVYTTSSHFTWQNGNCTTWIDTAYGELNQTRTYTYDNTNTASDGDYLNATQMMTYGALYIKNKNLVLSASEDENRKFAYTFDRYNKITAIRTTITFASTSEEHIMSRQYQLDCK